MNYLILLCVTIILLPLNSAAMSPELLKLNSDNSYKKLTTCIKTKGDTSKCIKPFKEYIKKESTYIRKAKDNKRKQRLVDTVAFLKKSVDLFYKKSNNGRDLIMLEKASVCATLLISLSSKYDEYKQIIALNNKQKNRPKISIHLKQKLKQLQQCPYPTQEYLVQLTYIIDKLKKYKSILNANDQREFLKLGHNLIEDNLNYFNENLVNIKEKKLTNFNTATIRASIYTITVKIPHLKEEKPITNIIGAISKSYNIYINDMVTSADHAIKKYVDQNPLSCSFTTIEMLSELEDFICSYKTICNEEKLFSKINYLPNDKFNSLVKLSEFLSLSYSGCMQIKQKQLLTAIQTYDEALNLANLNTLPDRLVDIAQKRLRTSLDLKLHNMKQTAMRLAENNLFNDAIKSLVVIRGFYPDQVDAIEDEKKKITILQSKYVTKKINVLISDGKFNEAYEFLDMECNGVYCKELRNKIVNAGKEHNKYCIKEKTQQITQQLKRKEISLSEGIKRAQNITLPFYIRGVISYNDINEKMLKDIKSNWRSYVRNGILTINNINQAMVFFNASDNSNYTMNPLLEKQHGYFSWSGTLLSKEGDKYTVWDVDQNPFYDGFIFKDLYIKRGFVFTDIIKKFNNLQLNTMVHVVGEYVGNTTITFTSGQRVVVPIIVGCYVY